MVVSINALQAYSFQNVSSPASTQTSRAAGAQPNVKTGATGDMVSISEDALAKFEESIEAVPYTPGGGEEEEVALDEGVKEWLERLDLVEGTRTLKNGRTQEVTIEGGSFVIKEYDGDRLASAVSGEITASGVSVDSIIYNKNGQVAQTGHLELTEGEEGVAEMDRSFQWFENKKLVRGMQDSMTLDSSSFDIIDNSLWMEEDDSDAGMENLLLKTSKDTNITTYTGAVQEYANGNLIREASIERKATNVNLTNRSGVKDEVNHLEPWTTREEYGSSDLIIRMTEYDSDGDKIRESSFSEEYSNGHEDPEDGEMQQNISVSWYANGELVKHSHGGLSLEETENTGLRDRADILEILNMSEDEYVSRDAQSASELLGHGVKESATDAGFFTDSLRKYFSSGKYDSAENISEGRAGDRPYAAQWTNEIYQDGKLAARQVDKEKSRDSGDDDPLSFRTGGGLTEDDYRAVLRTSEHVDETYENGRLKQEASIEAREYVDRDEDGPDTVKTFMKGKISKNGSSDSVDKTVVGGLDETDREAHKATEAMAGEMDLSFDDAFQLFRRLDPSQSEMLGVEIGD